MIRTLFVCTGNTCRSPMAAALLQNKINSASAGTAYSVASAGLAAWPGQPASPEAVLVMGQRGLSLADHRAQQVDFDQIAASRIVLTMTRAHKEALLRLFPPQRIKSSRWQNTPAGGSMWLIQSAERCRSIILAPIN